MCGEIKEECGCACKDEREEFKEMIGYTLSGYGIGLALGAVLDFLGMPLNAVGNWLVRTFSGEGESIFEGIFAIKKKIQGKAMSLAQAYGWGKFFGMTLPWIIDFTSRLLGVDMLGVQAFYIPYFYALSDQMGASVSGFMYFSKKEGNAYKGFKAYIKNPVMIAGLVILAIVPAGLLGARLLGFKPDTQIYSAIETIAANLCWIPPLIGIILIKKEKPEDDKN